MSDRHPVNGIQLFDIEYAAIMQLQANLILAIRELERRMRQIRQIEYMRRLRQELENGDVL